MDDRTLGQRLARLRHEQALTLQELGQRSGLKHQNIWRIENGGRGGDVRSATLAKLCVALHISADFLLGLGEDLPGHLVYERPGTEAL